MTDIYLSKKWMVMKRTAVKTSTLGDMFDESRVRMMFVWRY